MLHVRHLAWLASCPVDTTKSKDKRNRYQRFESIDPEAPELTPPELDGEEYLVNLLHEAGPVGSNGYGVEGLKWSEIHSWIATTGLFLCPWECVLIKEMSEAYASEFNKSNGKETPPPYKVITLSREEVSSKVMDVFKSLQINKGIK